MVDVMYLGCLYKVRQYRRLVLIHCLSHDLPSYHLQQLLIIITLDYGAELMLLTFSDILRNFLMCGTSFESLVQPRLRISEGYAINHDNR